MKHVPEEQTIILLNEDFIGENQAIIHYLTHTWTVMRLFGESITAIARDEMRHFKWLAQAVVALGGMPAMDPPALLPALNGLEALE